MVTNTRNRVSKLDKPIFSKHIIKFKSYIVSTKILMNLIIAKIYDAYDKSI